MSVADKELLRYWKTAIGRAAEDTGRILHLPSKSKILTSGVVLALVVAVLAQMGIGVTERLVWVIATFVVIAVLAVAVFVSQLIMAPARLASDAETHNSKRVAALGAAVADLQADRAALVSALDDRATERERQRQASVLHALRQEWILDNDGISSRMMAGLEPLPKEWVERRLAQMGETWRREVYY